MVESETRRDAETLVRNPSPRLFGKKFRDSKKVKTNHAKTRLRDLSKTLPRFRDPVKIFRDPRFSRYHSPPLILSDQTKTTEGEHSFAFHVEDYTNRHHNINPTGLLVDTGATSHIVTTNTFKGVDGTFKPTEHCLELADGTKTKNIAVKRGDTEVILKDVNGRHVKTVLKDALFIPSYPQDIFSVKAATSNGAEL